MISVVTPTLIAASIKVPSSAGTFELLTFAVSDLDAGRRAPEYAEERCDSSVMARSCRGATKAKSCKSI